MVPATFPALVRTFTRCDLLICALLAFFTIALYAPVRNHDFVSLDDSLYVTDNPWVRGGFSLSSLRAAFIPGPEGFWFPLTRLSHTLDFSLFGDNASGHHLVALGFHVLSTLALYFFFVTATGAQIPAAMTAAVFAWHPIHVESVAWVAERKDVLSAFFFFLTLWAWTRYVQAPSRRRYAVALAFFTLALLSKPMVVTLPVLLLILDFWPFRRTLSPDLLREKIPFGILAAFGAVAAFLTQSGVGAVKSVSAFPLFLRIENSLVTWVHYVRSSFWPNDLGVVYPYPQAIPLVEVALALGILATFSGLAFWLRGRYPYLLAGWLWYLVSTLPVIGIIQVGMASRTDHFMYIPLIGLAFPACRFLGDTVTRRPRLALPLYSLAILAGTGMVATCARQISWWKASEPLYLRAMEVAPDNYLAYIYMARRAGATPERRDEAIAWARRAVRLRPEVDGMRSTLAAILVNAQRYPEALQEAQAALRISDSPEARTAMGASLAGLGNVKAALPWLEAGVHGDPANLNARAILANAYIRSGDPASARTLLNDPLYSTSGDTASEDLFGTILILAGDTDAGIRRLEHALELNPNNWSAHNNLGTISFGIPGQHNAALFHLREAIRLSPSFTDAYFNLGGALLRVPGRAAEAVPYLEEGLRRKPNPEMQARLDQLKASLAGQR